MTRIKIPANGKKVPLFGIINILTLFLVNFVSFYGPCYKVKYHGFQEQYRNEFFSLKFCRIRKIFYVLYEYFLLQMNIYYEFYYEKLILFMIYLSTFSLLKNIYLKKDVIINILLTFSIHPP